MIDLSGRVVIVTGGDSGIARAGVPVAIWSRREERNAEAVAELEKPGRHGDHRPVRRQRRGQRRLRQPETLGRLDCLVANAETLEGTPTPQDRR